MHSYQRFVLKTVHKFHKTLKTNVYCGERGIRTPGTGKSVRQFSKLLVSATHPSHHESCTWPDTVKRPLKRTGLQRYNKIIVLQYFRASRCQPGYF